MRKVKVEWALLFIELQTWAERNARPQPHAGTLHKGGGKLPQPPRAAAKGQSALRSDSFAEALQQPHKNSLQCTTAAAHVQTAAKWMIDYTTLSEWNYVAEYIRNI